MSSRGGGGGGHATAAGVQFQVNVAADLVVGMLAERDYEPPWRWPRETTIESVRVETSEPTDDISASTSLGGRAYIQAKNSLDLGTPATSEFGKAVTQLVLCASKRDRIRTPARPAKHKCGQMVARVQHTPQPQTLLWITSLLLLNGSPICSVNLSVALAERRERPRPENLTAFKLPSQFPAASDNP